MAVSVDVSTIGAGVLGGVVFAVGGYFKNPKDAQGVRQAFDGKKFALTALTGALVGGVAGALGMSYEDANGFLYTMGILGGLTALVDTLFKAASRSLAK